MEVTKIPLLALNTDDSIPQLPEGHYRAMKNIIPSVDGVSGGTVKQKPKGTVQIPLTLPVGTNKTIGVFEDKDNNYVIFFNYNSQGEHGIYLINAENDVVRRIITGSFLDFDADMKIVHVGVVDKFLFWLDGKNPQRVLDLTRSYTGVNPEHVFLNKIPPTKEPLVQRRTNGTLGYNYIWDDNYQFAYKYIYRNGEETKLSPYSKVSYAKMQDGSLVDAPIFDITYNKFNEILVTLQVDSLVIDEVKEVRVFYRRNGGDWINFETIDDISSTIEVTLTAPVDGTVLTNEETNNSVPVTSGSLATKDNLLFLTSTQEGYSLDDSSASILLSPIQTLITESETRGFKRGGTYSFGIIYEDQFGNISQVDAKKTITIPFVKPSPANPLIINRDIQVQVDISGTPPSFAKRYAVVRTRNNFQSTYMQIPVYLQWYAGQRDPDSDTAERTQQYYRVNDALFREEVPTNADQFSSIYLQMPKEIPFLPDTDCYVRIVSDNGDYKIEKVRSVTANWIEVGNFGVTDWDSVRITQPAIYEQGSSAKKGWFKVLVEVFKIQETPSELFFEVVNTEDQYQWYDITDPGTDTRAFSDTSIKVFGDTFRVAREGEDYQFHFNKLNIERDSDSFDNINGEPLTATVETPVIVCEKVNKLAEETTKFDPDSISFLDFVFNPGDAVVVQKSETSYTFDYSKITEELGRPSVEVKSNQIRRQDTTIRWSNRYVENSNIFGLNRFDALDFYVVPSERSKITKLQVVGDALLAIHERSATTLLVNENIITTADGQDQVTITDRVIGYDRELKGGYGTMHPESVVEHGGKAFWFDVSKGEIIRYNFNGLTPLGRTYKNSTYLRDLANNTISQSANVSAGYDPFLEIYYLTVKGASGFIDQKIATTFGFTGENQRLDISSLDNTKDYQLSMKVTAPSANDGLKIIVTDQDGTIRGFFSTSEGEKDIDVLIDLDYGDFDYLDFSSNQIDSIFTIVVNGYLESDYKKTIAFVDKDTQERFLGEFDFYPEFYCKANNKLYSFVDGQPWIHGKGATNEFYGETFPSSFTIVHNDAYSVTKAYKGIGVESSQIWSSPEIKTGTQETELPADEFEFKETMYYADLLRDKNTPAEYLEPGQIALRNGEEMRGKHLLISMYNDADDPSEISYVNVAFIKSFGHRRI